MIKNDNDFKNFLTFMGYEIINGLCISDSGVEVSCIGINYKNEFTALDDLLYLDNSFDFVFPALQKISYLDYGRFVYELKHDRIEIWDWAFGEKGYFYYSLLKKDSLTGYHDVSGGIYLAIIHFLNWYNQK